jgi:hypothetical protein
MSVESDSSPPLPVDSDCDPFRAGAPRRLKSSQRSESEGRARRDELDVSLLVPHPGAPRWTAPAHVALTPAEAARLIQVAERGPMVKRMVGVKENPRPTITAAAVGALSYTLVFSHLTLSDDGHRAGREVEVGQVQDDDLAASRMRPTTEKASGSVRQAHGKRRPRH